MTDRFSLAHLGVSVVATVFAVGLIATVAQSGERCRTRAGLGSVPSHEAPKAHAVVYEECGDRRALVAAIVFDFPDLPPAAQTSDRIEALMDELRESLGDFQGSRPGLSLLGRGVLQIVADAQGERVKVRYADFDTEPLTLVDLALDEDAETVQTIHVDLSDYPMMPRVRTGALTRPPEADPGDAGAVLRSWAPADGRFRDLNH